MVIYCSSNSLYATMRFLVSLILAVLLISNLGANQEDKILRLATTSSTENSGLLNKILPDFEKQSGLAVHVIAVGTGKALRMGKDGDADVLLVHAPTAEKEFVELGYGLNRTPVMYNDFVIVGPKMDPADIASKSTIPKVMKALVASQSIFVSRADDSGTHKKELSFWAEANIKPGGSNYREAGQGMGRVLHIAGELNAYTLVDRGTWLAYKGKSPLDLLFEGNPRLFNPYSIVQINPSRFADLNHSGAQKFIHWMTSTPTQKMIGEYQINGQSLFFPDA